jgi:hypothetical protein
VSLERTDAGANLPTPFSSASLSYPIGASSLYSPSPFPVNLTVEDSLARLGRVVVSVAEGAIVLLRCSTTKEFPEESKIQIPLGLTLNICRE